MKSVMPSESDSSTSAALADGTRYDVLEAQSPDWDICRDEVLGVLNTDILASSRGIAEETSSIASEWFTANTIGCRVNEADRGSLLVPVASLLKSFTILKGNEAGSDLERMAAVFIRHKRKYVAFYRSPFDP